ncbi:Kunitz/Bovine pancreatic trypsin inhibitor domain protein, partial [Oesophagostomum dentatum]
VPGLLIISSFTQAQQEELCYTEVDQGHTCDTAKPGLRYFYDATTNSCWPFLYKGCGGNKNNYKSDTDCLIRCMFMDGGLHCAGRRPETGLCNNKGQACPEGSICKYGLFGSSANGICCDSETEEQYRKERNPVCDNDKVLLKTRDSTGWVPFLGKKCSHEFCPEGADCVEGKWFSHCCESA